MNGQRRREQIGRWNEEEVPSSFDRLQRKKIRTGVFLANERWTDCNFAVEEALSISVHALKCHSNLAGVCLIRSKSSRRSNGRICEMPI